MKYRIYFQIYDKKMSALIEADNLEEAKKKLQNQLIIDKIVPVKDESLNLEALKKILGM